MSDRMQEGAQNQSRESSPGSMTESAASDCGQDLVQRPKNIQAQLARLADPDTRIRALATCAVCRLGERMQSQIDRMEYFRKLLQAACGATLDTSHDPQSLRADRLRAGVDFPELDTVPHWAEVSDDGRISIPFIEFIVTGIDAELSCFSRHPELSAGDLKKIKRVHTRLADLLREITPDDEPSDGLPRLREVFVDPNKLVPLCEENGLLHQAIAACRTGCERIDSSS